MPFEPINEQKEPIRLFESNFLEFFTHISPIVVLIIWVPIVGICLGLAFMSGLDAGLLPWMPFLFLIGLFFWTFAEYVLHRFVFHFHAKNKFQERITFLFHGIHHTQPQSKTRLVMPPVVSIPMAGIFFLLFRFIFGFTGAQSNFMVYSLFAAFITGYLCYDMIHYGIHHFTIRAAWLKKVKLHHMQHHYKTPEMRFGVSSPLWDFVFGTNPK